MAPPFLSRTKRLQKKRRPRSATPYSLGLAAPPPAYHLPGRPFVADDQISLQSYHTAPTSSDENTLPPDYNAGPLFENYPTGGKQPPSDEPEAEAQPVPAQIRRVAVPRFWQRGRICASIGGLLSWSHFWVALTVAFALAVIIWGLVSSNTASDNSATSQ